MFKKLTVGAILASALIAGTAYGAVSLTDLVVDGGTDTTVSEGSTVDAEVTFDVTSSTDVESLSWEMVGSGLPKECVNVSNSITDGTFTRSFDIDTQGATEGSWDVRIGLYGDDGANASNLCENTDQIGGFTTFGDRITITDNNDDNQDDDNNTGGDEQSALEQAIANLTAQVGCMVTGGTWTGSSCTPKPAPVVNTVCAEYSALSAGLYQGSDTRQGGRVGQLQSFLMYKGFDIPLLSQNKAPYGFFGPQTAGANASFRMVNNCS